MEKEGNLKGEKNYMMGIGKLLFVFIFQGDSKLQVKVKVNQLGKCFLFILEYGKDVYLNLNFVVLIIILF